MGHNLQCQQNGPHVLPSAQTRKRSFSSFIHGPTEIPLHMHEETRHLGVLLSDTLSWSSHISGIIRRQKFHVFVLQRLAKRRYSANVVKRLFTGLVRPALEYASVLWDGCNQHDRLALERLQLAIARSILSCSRRDYHNQDVLRLIGWPTLAWRRRRQSLLTLWDLLHGQGPSDLAQSIPKTAPTRAAYAFRNASIAFPRCKTEHRLKSFLPASIVLYNSLPASISSCSSRSLFTNALNCHFSHDMYSFGLT